MGSGSRALVVATIVFASSAARADVPSPAPQPKVRRWSEAVVFELASGFVPFANDVPLMAGVAIRFADVHEIWARAGYMPTGDDRGYGFGVGGYRAVLRPHKLVRPIIGALTAALPATCSHLDRPPCTNTSLFIFAALGGVRIEPLPWLGFSAVISFGADTYPNPFGMVELGVSFALPLS